MKQIQLVKIPRLNSGVSEGHFYGIDIDNQTRDSRAMLTRNGYYGDWLWLLLSPISFTKGNGWSSNLNGDRRKPLSEILTQILDLGYQVYEFNTFLELATWCAGGSR